MLFHLGTINFRSVGLKYFAPISNTKKSLRFQVMPLLLSLQQHRSHIHLLAYKPMNTSHIDKIPNNQSIDISSLTTKINLHSLATPRVLQISLPAISAAMISSQLMARSFRSV